MICGVVAEYNMFHNGHKYLIDEIKKRHSAVVSVMSGSFVQRGDVAVTDKWTRAKAALMGGCDLVLELPVCYSLNAAPNFASGAAAILDTLGVIDSMCFGSEAGDISLLESSAMSLENESGKISSMIKDYLSRGMSYPAALSKAYEGVVSEELLSSPNNILAVEYIRALIRMKSSIKPETIKRYKADHHDSGIYSGISSASKIRDMICCGRSVDALLPYSLDSLEGDIPYDISRLDSALISKLRMSDTEYIKNISEVSEGLENRIISAAHRTDSFNSLCEAVKNKRFTMSKIRRIIIASLIGFTKDIYTPKPQYIRVLGMNRTGMEILKKAKKTCIVPIITKAADFKESSPQFRLDTRATDIAAICSPNPKSRTGGRDFTTSPVII